MKLKCNARGDSFNFARRHWEPKRSLIQESKECSVIELRSKASETVLYVAPFSGNCESIKSWCKNNGVHQQKNDFDEKQRVFNFCLWRSFRISRQGIATFVGPYVRGLTHDKSI